MTENINSKVMFSGVEKIFLSCLSFLLCLNLHFPKPFEGLNGHSYFTHTNKNDHNKHGQFSKKNQLGIAVGENYGNCVTFFKFLTDKIVVVRIKVFKYCWQEDVSLHHLFLSKNSKQLFSQT